VRYAVLDELRPGGDEAEPFVVADEVALGVEDTGPVADPTQRRLQQLGSEPGPPRVACDGDATDPCTSLGLVHDSQVGNGPVRGVTFEPHVDGRRVGIAPVQFGIAARLLDDEHVDPQP
jgi:hypothetical protein